MKIEWTKKADGVHTGKAGKLFDVLVAPSDDEWLATVTLVSRDGSAEVDYDQALRPTLEEAKQAALTIVDRTLRILYGAVVIAEREACARIARDRADAARKRGSWSAAHDEALAIEAAIRARSAEDSEP